MRLNLGCCDKLEEGYLNIDLNPLLPGVLPADAMFLPFRDNSIDEVRASHLLEHFELKDVKSALVEWYRVLKSGGIILVIVPDMTEIAKRWVTSSLDRKIFWWNPAIFGSHRGEGQDHMCGLDREILLAVLDGVGFRNIKASYSHEFWVHVRGEKFI